MLGTMRQSYTIADRRMERGNVLFLILVAVILFGALAYAVSRSNIGSGSVSDERAQVSFGKGADILNNASTLMTRLNLRSCDLSTMPATSAGAAPGNANCAFYGNHGGGFSYTSNDLAETQPIMRITRIAVPNIGSAAEDVVGNLFLIDAAFNQKPVCNLINQKNGITYTENLASDDYYTDAIVANLGATSGTSLPAAFTGKQQGCFWDKTSGYYVMYQVLLEQ